MAGNSNMLLSELLRVDDWQVRSREGLIKREGTVEVVRPRTMEVLSYLARKSGEMVRNDELIEEIWVPTVDSDTAVVGLTLRTTMGLLRR